MHSLTEQDFISLLDSTESSLSMGFSDVLSHDEELKLLGMLQFAVLATDHFSRSFKHHLETLLSAYKHQFSEQNLDHINRLFDLLKHDDVIPFKGTR